MSSRCLAPALHASLGLGGRLILSRDSAPSRSTSGSSSITHAASKQCSYILNLICFHRLRATTLRNPSASVQLPRKNAGKFRRKTPMSKPAFSPPKCLHRWRWLVRNKMKFGSCKRRCSCAVAVAFICLFFYACGCTQAIKREETAIQEEKERLESRRATVCGRGCFNG